MVSNSGGRPTARWTALVVGGVVSAAVLVSGLTWAVADDDNPFRRPEAKTGERPPPPPREAKGDRDRGARPGPDERMPSPPFGPGGPPEIREMIEKIEKAASDGDIDEVRKVMGELRRQRPLLFGPHLEGVRDGDPRPGPRGGEGDRGPGPRDGDRGPRPQNGEGTRRPAPREGEGDRRPAPRDGDRATRPGEGGRGRDERPGEPNRGERPPNAGNPFEAGGRPQPPLGVALAPVPELLAAHLGLDEGTGLVVAGVVPGSPADEAGLKKFDVIVRFADANVGRDARRFQEQVLARPAGSKVEMTVIRGGKKESMTAILAARRPGEAERPGDRRPDRNRD